MTMRPFLLLIFFFTPGFAAASHVLATAEPQADQDEAKDAPKKTPNATFLKPAGWAIHGEEKGWVLAPPEGDFDLAVVDVPDAADAAAAAASAWQRQYPGFGRKLQGVTAAAPKEGWDEIQTLYYETAPNEKLVAQALAYRAGSQWTVLLLKGNMATFLKRGGAAFVTLGSVRPLGYKPESFADRRAHRLDASRIDSLKKFVTHSMQTLSIPGASLAVLDHGRLVFSGGFGLREIGKPDKVDADTLFMIASNTKGMTTLMLAKEVDAGYFAWTDKVARVYPPFRLGSAETTAKVEMRHLVCACTGMPRRDIPDAFTYRLDTPSNSIFKSLADTEPTSAFGESFQYSNTMAAAAGLIGGHLAYPQLEIGAAYDKAMQTKVFDPLGMKRTTFDWDRALSSAHASPHGPDIRGNLAVADLSLNRTIYPGRPAGGAWSSANDVIKYVGNELRRGVLPSGKRYVSEQNLLVRRKSNVQLGADSFYGMGLLGTRIAGVTAYHHGGSLIGYRSDIYFVPDADVGAVLLTNSESGEALLTPFLRRLLEVLYDGKPEAEATVAAGAGPGPLDTIRKSLTWPADPKLAAQVAGRYVGPELGTVILTQTADGLTLSNGVFSVPMGSKTNSDGSASVVTAGPGFTGLDFVVTNEGGKRGLVLRDGQHEYYVTAAEP